MKKVLTKKCDQKGKVTTKKGSKNCIQKRTRLQKGCTPKIRGVFLKKSAQF